MKTLLEINGDTRELLIPDGKGGSIYVEFLNRSWLYDGEFLVFFPLVGKITDPSGLIIVLINEEANTYSLLRKGDALFNDYVADFIEDYELDYLDNISPRLKTIYTRLEDEEAEE